MSEKRIDRWAQEITFPAFFTSPDEEVSELVKRRSQDTKLDDDEDSGGLSQFNVLRAAKELIFDKTDEGIVFHIIVYAINAKQLDMEIVHLLDQVIKSDDSEELKEDVKKTLALAHALDVPVYPNTEELSPVLAAYHRDMLVDGFRLRSSDGDESFYRLTRSPGDLVDTFGYIENIKISETHSPAELHLIQKNILNELRKHELAGRVLASLRLAIKELSSLLDIAITRDEHELQRCITRNPILFGLEYKRVIPKHKLGSEYEMDYALERISGIIDLVEIEASTHKLFTKKGDPTKPLIHAEQQVLDWLDWIEKHSPYARENLPGLINPIGYVIIGREQSLTESDKARLKRRNVIMRDTIRIMTYDDFLEKARNLLDVLEGQAGEISTA